MSPRKIVAVAISGALLAGGGIAVAAVTKSDREQAIIDDAAKRLDVTPKQLTDALSAAENAQLDKAVKDGELTQAQADAIKARRKQSGRVLGGGRPGPGHRGGGRHGGRGNRGALGADLAKALGISQTELRTQLRDGKSVADIAKAEGKTLASVKSAVKAATKTRLDKAVKDGDITQTQADRMLDRFDKAFDHLGKRRHGPRGNADPDANPNAEPGAFRPNPADPADVVPAGDTVTS